MRFPLTMTASALPQAMQEQLSQRFRDRKDAILGRGLSAWPLLTHPDDLPLLTSLRELLAEDARTVVDPVTGLTLNWKSFLPAELLLLLQIGDYERADLDLFRKHIRPGDHVCEMGGGIGLTGMLACRESGHRVRIIEPNPHLALVIAENFDLNDLRVDLWPFAVSREDSVPFTVAANYWWSAIGREPGPEDKVIDVPGVPPDIAMYTCNVLCIDIEGAEHAVLTQPIPDSIERIIAEIHTPDIGAAAMGEILTALVRQGFSIMDQAAWTWVFERT